MDFDSAPDESQQQQRPQQPIKFDDAPDESQQQAIHFDSAPDESQQGNQRTWPEEIGRDIRTGLRGVLPTVGGIAGAVVGGAAGAAAGSAVPFVGTTAGGIAGGVGGALAGANIAQNVQNKLGDALGIDSPESRAADATNPSWGTTAAEFAPLAASLTTGAGEVRLATRLATGAITGMVNLGQQAATKGTDNIDLGEAALSAGVGVALPKVRPWLEGGLAPITSRMAPAGAVQGGLNQGQGGGEPAGGAAPTPALKEAAATPEAAAARDDVSVSKPVASPGLGVAQEHTPAEGYAAEQPSDGLTNTGDGFQSKVGGIGRDQGKGNAATGEEIPGATSVPLEPLDPSQGGMSAGMADALRGQQEYSPEADIYGGQNEQTQTQAPPRPEPAPPSPEQGPPEGQQAPQAPRPPLPPIPEDLSIPENLRRTPPGIEPPARPLTPLEQNIADMKARRAQGTLAEQPPSNTLEQLRASATLADQTAPRPETVQGAKPGEEPQYSDEELDARIGRHPLSAGAPTEEEMGYGPNAPRAAVQAKNGGLWQRANAAFDKLFKTPQLLFASGSISPLGEQADKIITKHMGMGKADLAQYNNALQTTDKYFSNMSPLDRTSTVTDYENGPIPADHPGRAFMEQARSIAGKLDDVLTAAGGEGTYARQSIPSFFEEGQRKKLREDMELYKQENGRYPTLGEAMKWGFKLNDDLLNADGSPDPQKVINQQNFAKHLVIESKSIIKDMSEGWEGGKGIGIRPADSILHDAPGDGLVKIDPEVTGGVSKYGAPEVKRVLEAYLNPTLRDGTIKTAYEGYMKAKTISNQISLMGGIYHMRFMFQEAPINEVSQGFGRILKNPGEGIKDIIKSPLSPYTLFKVGKNDVFDAIMHPEAIKDPYDKVILKTALEGGLLPIRVRGMGVTPELETGAVKGLASAWKPAFQEYLRDQVQAGLKIKNKFQGNKAEGIKPDYLGAAGDTSMASLKALTEGMQLIMHPMFNTYIPMLKSGAVFSNLKRFYIDNPGLSHDDYVKAARNFVRATDNAMGELNQSTLYAPAYIKAIANGAMVSAGWNVGSGKQFLGGVRSFIRNPKGAFTGPDYDPRIMYIPAFMAVTALSNIAVQLLHGQGPPKDLTDVAFPRSGGTTKAGNPERIIQPGYEKDVAEAANVVGGPDPSGQAFTKMMYNKLAPFPKTLIDEFIYNQNFAGKQIANPNDPFVKRLGEYMEYFVKHALNPIAVQSATADNNPKSKIGTVEHILGNRHAPQQWQDPQQYAARIQKQNEKAAKDAAKFHRTTGYAEGGVVGPELASAAAPYAQKGAQYMRHQVDKIITDQGNPFSQKANQQDQYENDKLTPQQ